MLTTANLPVVLTTLGFKQQGMIYTKSFNLDLLEVDVQKGEIHYPEAAGLVVNARQICNFQANENFVVLECVHRLLEKGYKPEHIELEPKWKLGHAASGGRADILVKDYEGNPLLMIECKTAGGEFTRAWNKTLQDGGQLFSYAQQISNTQFLCLYTSDFETEAVAYLSHVIAHRDNEIYLEEKPLLKGFKTATNVNERFAIWRDTYEFDYDAVGIFEDDIPPYRIGKNKYSLADLHLISDTDQKKKYHEYATILRQHNVSGRENAFDKLVNLLLCKIVDEAENSHDLKFYWKGVAYDTHFELMDRLQQLYQSGMKKFLGEDITYIKHDDVKNALHVIRQNPDATQRAVWKLFVQQKFFTNSDFSLLDVHNERLFYQNAEVVLKILKMWQDIRLTNPDGHNQFLGDLFEYFLDQGIKQSEGQYFTPMPICRFILMSLPLESLIQQRATPPKAIDYACGAGHFLTELAVQIKPLVNAHQPEVDVTTYYKAIFGIEKEYRLSKVAKVSAFMYGQRDINICYGDALFNQHAAFPAIQDGSFHLLVANPPYSVRGFLATLPEVERKAYTLTNTINDFDTANSIETFFIERAKQLLCAGGVAAIILPSSILSNGSNTYIRAREILLHYFDIVAIAEFGSGTFGKTGTNTVTLFLRRKKIAPDSAEHYCERVADWFKGSHQDQKQQVIYQDNYLVAQYAAHIGVALDDYQSLLDGVIDGGWCNHDYFTVYADKFSSSVAVSNLRKANWFKQLTKTEQEAELKRRYFDIVREIERDKLYHFVMASEQANSVLIIRSPSDTKAAKQFLGYDWSAAKGDEGIKLVKDAAGNHVTPLYDPKNRNNATKLNWCVAANFDGTLNEIPPEVQDVVRTARLVDLLDFSQAGFDKQINLVLKSRRKIISKWPIVPLGTIAEIRKGSVITEKKAVPGLFKVVAGGMRYAYTHNVANRPAHTITISASGTAGFVNFWREPIFASDCSTVRGTNDEQTTYLFYVLKSRQNEIEAIASGSVQPHVYPKDLAALLIPVPDAETINTIILECNSIDQQVAEAQSRIEITNAEVDNRIKAATAPYQRKALSAIASLSRGASPRPIDEYLTEAEDGIPWIKIGDVASDVKYIAKTAQKITLEGSKKSRLVQRGDFVISNSMSVGRPYILAIDGCVHDGWLIVAEIAPEVNRDFLYYALSSSDAQHQFKARALGGVVQNLNIDRAKTVTIPIPPLAEQHTLVTAIEALEHQITAAQAVIDTAPRRKQAILQQHLS